MAPLVARQEAAESGMVPQRWLDQAHEEAIQRSQRLLDNSVLAPRLKTALPIPTHPPLPA